MNAHEIRESLESQVRVDVFPDHYRVTVKAFGIWGVFQYIPPSACSSQNEAVEFAYSEARYRYQLAQEEIKGKRSVSNKRVGELARLTAVIKALEAERLTMAVNEATENETADQRSARISRQLLNEAIKTGNPYFLATNDNAVKFMISPGGDSFAKTALVGIVKRKGWEEGHTMVGGLLFLLGIINDLEKKEAEADSPGEA